LDSDEIFDVSIRLAWFSIGFDRNLVISVDFGSFFLQNQWTTDRQV
jgi:hypothetical protein